METQELLKVRATRQTQTKLTTILSVRLMTTSKLASLVTSRTGGELSAKAENPTSRARTTTMMTTTKVEK